MDTTPEPEVQSFPYNTLEGLQAKLAVIVDDARPKWIQILEDQKVILVIWHPINIATPALPTPSLELTSAQCIDAIIELLVIFAYEAEEEGVSDKKAEQELADIVDVTREDVIGWRGGRSIRPDICLRIIDAMEHNEVAGGEHALDPAVRKSLRRHWVTSN